MRKMLGFLLRRLDSAIVKAAGWKHIPHSDTDLMYMSIYKYKGPTITLSDGTAVKRGDWIAELHLDNKGLKLLDTSYTNLIRLLKGELKSLRECFKEEAFSHIRAVFGITLFYEIADRQGFTVLDIRSTVKRFLWSLWENLLRVSFRRKNKKARNRLIMSKECWISKDQILGNE